MSELVPSISLAVQTRRAGPLLVQALRSAADQLRPCDEVCIFDNQEVPGLGLGGLEFPCAVRIVQRDAPLGFQGSWSTGLGLADRPWVLWLHDDDLLAPGAVARLRAAARDHGDAALIWGQADYFYGDHVQWTTRPERPPEVWTSEYALARYLFTHVHPPSGTLMRREALRRALPIPADAGANADTWLFQRIVLCGGAVVLHTTILGNRLHASSLTSATNRKTFSAGVQHRRAICAGLLRERRVPWELIVQAAKDSDPATVVDTMRSLVRARDPFARALQHATRAIPSIAGYPGWERAARGVRYGRWAMDLEGLVQLGLDYFSSRSR